MERLEDAYIENPRGIACVKDYCVPFMLYVHTICLLFCHCYGRLCAFITCLNGNVSLRKCAGYYMSSTLSKFMLFVETFGELIFPWQCYYVE